MQKLNNEKYMNEQQQAIYRKILPSNPNTPKSKPIFLVENKYYIITKIGGGSFGAIYKATDYKSKENVAIKLQDLSNNNEYYLQQEVNTLKEFSKIFGFATLYSFGKIEDKFYLVMKLLGSNLENLMYKCGGSFSLDTVNFLALQFIERLQILHENSYIHRDIKPENFVIGVNKDVKNVYLIDFGLAKLYSI